MIKKSVLKFKRGPKEKMPALHHGEPAYCTDTREVFIGALSGGMVQIATCNGQILPNLNADMLDGAHLEDLINIQRLVIREKPTEPCNNMNIDFSLKWEPIVGTESVFLNGLLQEDVEDYTIIDSNLDGKLDTVRFAYPPKSGDVIRITYIRKLPSEP